MSLRIRNALETPPVVEDVAAAITSATASSATLGRSERNNARCNAAARCKTAAGSVR